MRVCTVRTGVGRSVHVGVCARVHTCARAGVLADEDTMGNRHPAPSSQGAPRALLTSVQSSDTWLSVLWSLWQVESGWARLQGRMVWPEVLLHGESTEQWVPAVRDTGCLEAGWGAAAGPMASGQALELRAGFPQ